MIVIYAVKLMEILIVVLLLNCGGFGKLQHLINVHPLFSTCSSYSVNITDTLEPAYCYREGSYYCMSWPISYVFTGS